jgi:hypothetical protein
MKMRGTCAHGQKVDEPMPTITSGGNHVAEVRAFLIKYFGTDQDPRLEEPLHTVTTKDRFGLVIVTIAGEDYVIVDIGMRMLTPRELFNAQGFPPTYIIDRDAEGRPMTKTSQVARCGNSVSPPVAKALAAANVAPASRTPRRRHGATSTIMPRDRAARRRGGSRRRRPPISTLCHRRSTTLPAGAFASVSTAHLSVGRQGARAATASWRPAEDAPQRLAGADRIAKPSWPTRSTPGHRRDPPHGAARRRPLPLLDRAFRGRRRVPRPPDACAPPHFLPSDGSAMGVIRAYVWRIWDWERRALAAGDPAARPAMAAFYAAMDDPASEEAALWDHYRHCAARLGFVQIEEKAA